MVHLRLLLRSSSPVLGLSRPHYSSAQRLALGTSGSHRSPTIGALPLLPSATPADRVWKRRRSATASLAPCLLGIRLSPLMLGGARLFWSSLAPVLGGSDPRSRWTSAAPNIQTMHSATPLRRPWMVASYSVLSGHLVFIFGARGSAHRSPKIRVLALATFLRSACSAQTCDRFGPNGFKWCWRSVAHTLGCASARYLFGFSSALLALVSRSPLLSAKFTPLSPLGAVLSA